MVLLSTGNTYVSNFKASSDICFLSSSYYFSTTFSNYSIMKEIAACLGKTRNDRKFMSEGTLGDLWSTLPRWGQTRLFRALSSQVLKTSEDGGCTASLAACCTACLCFWGKAIPCSIVSASACCVSSCHI